MLSHSRNRRDLGYLARFYRTQIYRLSFDCSYIVFSWYNKRSHPLHQSTPITFGISWGASPQVKSAVRGFFMRRLVLLVLLSACLVLTFLVTSAANGLTFRTVSPPQGAQRVQRSSPLLSWLHTGEITDVTFRVFLGQSNPPTLVVPTDLTVCHVRVDRTLEANTTYHWYVQAFSRRDGRLIARTSVSFFNTGNLPPTAPKIVTPTSGATNVPRTNPIL